MWKKSRFLISSWVKWAPEERKEESQNEVDELHQIVYCFRCLAVKERYKNAKQTEKKSPMIWLLHSPVTGDCFAFSLSHDAFCFDEFAAFCSFRGGQTMKPFFYFSIKAWSTEKKGRKKCCKAEIKRGERKPSQNALTYTLRPCAIAALSYLPFLHIASSSVHVLNCPSGYLIIHFMLAGSLAISQSQSCHMKVWCIHKPTYKHVVCINKTHSLCLSMLHLSGSAEISIRGENRQTNFGQKCALLFAPFLSLLVCHSIQITFNDTARSAASFFFLERTGINDARETKTGSERNQYDPQKKRKDDFQCSMQVASTVRVPIPEFFVVYTILLCFFLLLLPHPHFDRGLAAGIIIGTMIVLFRLWWWCNNVVVVCLFFLPVRTYSHSMVSHQTE